jgi:3-phosphoinositide dependent protein kinase-1
MNEKKVLSIISHPGIVKLHFTFQDAHSLYYVLSLAEAGELYDDLARAGKYSVEATRFYAAELVQILAYLHGKNIVHRDLKPENILISQSRHLKLTDFGTSKIMRTRMEGKQGGKERRKSFVGTAEYVSPEVLGDRPAGKAADMWALGCVLFQMCTGTVPFRGESEYLTFKKIENFDMKTFPDDTEASLQDLIMKLLVVTPEERLGSTSAGYDLLRAHPFFAGVEWDTLWTQKPPSIVYINPSLTEQQLDSDETDSDEEAFNNTGRSEVKLEAETVSNSKKYSKWQQFLEPGESIIYTGFISKRRGLYAKERQLILTNFPRFIYVDTIAMVVRGTIPWSETLRGEVKTARQFYIHIPKRSYYMVGLSCGSRDWVNMIDKVKEVYTGETYFPIPKVE